MSKINDKAYTIDLLIDEFGVSNTFNVADLTRYAGEDLAVSRLMLFEGGEDDEDIPRLVPSSPLNDDQTIVAKKSSTDDIRMGPITRAKLPEQQVNLFLIEPNVFINENFILPKSWCVCILRFQEEGIVRGGEELKYLETEEEFMQEAAREEREAADQA
jgi:hypothetical protein